MGRMPYWKGLIRPFRDRLDIEVSYIFYSVPIENGYLPYPTVFTDRFWDHREHWFSPGVGTVAGSLKVLTQKPFVPFPDRLDDNPDGWLNGFLYSDYIAGKLPRGNCTPLPISCSAVSGSTPGTVYLDARQFTSFNSIDRTFARVYPMQQVAACQWEAGPFPTPWSVGHQYFWQLVMGSPSTLTLAHNAPTPINQVWETSDAWNGRSCLPLTLTPLVFPFTEMPPVLYVGNKPEGCIEMPPTGTIEPYLGSSAPGGYVLANGASYPQTGDFANLFALIGTTYNTWRGAAAPAAGQFRVPDFRGMALSGSGSAVASTGPPWPATSAHSRGDVTGNEGVSLATGNLPAHTHSITDPGHSHGIVDPGHGHGVTDPGHGHVNPNGSGWLSDYSGGSGAYDNSVMSHGEATDISPAVTGISVGNSATGISDNVNVTGITGTDPTGSGTPVNVQQPTAFVNWIIKL